MRPLGRDALPPAAIAGRAAHARSYRRRRAGLYAHAVSCTCCVMRGQPFQAPNPPFPLLSTQGLLRHGLCLRRTFLGSVMKIVTAYVCWDMAHERLIHMTVLVSCTVAIGDAPATPVDKIVIKERLTSISCQTTLTEPIALHTRD